MHVTKHGFTIIELLVIVALLAVMAALLLPAVQAARESARSLTCQNNLKQIGTALLTHHDNRGSFPYGGWGFQWVGVPGRGSQMRQPGGWIYSLLPFLEQQELYELGGQSSGPMSDALYAQRLRTPICTFNCPSRRPCRAWPVADTPPHLAQPLPAGNLQEAARSDYAINGGTWHIFVFPGPSSLEEADYPLFEWPSNANFTGIAHLRIGVDLKRVVDGASKTYLVGEKFLNPEHYFNGESLGDNETMYSGHSVDVCRFATADLPPDHDGTRISADPQGIRRFGSAHAGGCFFVYCDGSVRRVNYDVSAEVHYRAAHRRDLGEPMASEFASR